MKMIKKGQKYKCVSYNVVDFTKGNVYVSESDNYITDDYNIEKFVHNLNIDRYFELQKETDEIVDRVISQYRDRSEVGIKKYGTTLSENNEDDFLLHLQQELMDATLYIEKLRSISWIHDLVLVWAKNKGILDNATPMSQALKTLEEVNELLVAINNKNDAEIKDAFGDIFVTIIIGARLSGLSIFNCLESAYNEIKDRTGKMENGTFVKDK